MLANPCSLLLSNKSPCLFSLVLVLAFGSKYPSSWCSLFVLFECGVGELAKMRLSPSCASVAGSSAPEFGVSKDNLSFISASAATPLSACWHLELNFSDVTCS